MKEQVYSQFRKKLGDVAGRVSYTVNNAVDKVVELMDGNLGAVFGVAAVIGIGGLIVYSSSKPPVEPKSVNDYRTLQGRDIYENSIVDMDNDGDADIVLSFKSSSPVVRWVAPDMIKLAQDNYPASVNSKTPRMTPEIQNLATIVLQNQRELEYAQDKEAYRIYVGKHKEKGRK
jgi:hypothetical protein